MMVCVFVYDWSIVIMYGCMILCIIELMMGKCFECLMFWMNIVGNVW